MFLVEFIISSVQLRGGQCSGRPHVHIKWGTQNFNNFSLRQHSKFFFVTLWKIQQTIQHLSQQKEWHINGKCPPPYFWTKQSQRVKKYFSRLQAFLFLIPSHDDTRNGCEGDYPNTSRLGQAVLLPLSLTARSPKVWPLLIYSHSFVQF